AGHLPDVRPTVPPLQDGARAPRPRRRGCAMRWLTLFIIRPVTTTLLSIALVLTGVLAYRLLPVAPLPEIDFPMISVSARMAGASPETMASSVAMPLEQALGSIAGL